MTVSSSIAPERLPIIHMHLPASGFINVEQPAGAVLTADPLAPGEHEVELRGINVWYLVSGSGPVLLIQPGGAGWGGDATIYIETFLPLEAEHTLVYYDPPGIGRSGRSEDNTRYSLAEYVEDLEALRRHLGLDMFSLAGHSHGGFVALKYALAYPERVERLLVLNSGVFVRELDPGWLESRKGYEEVQARFAAIDTTLTPNEMHAEFIRSFVPIVHFYDYEPVQKTVEELLARTTYSVEPFQQFQLEVAMFDILEQVAEIRVPTLIVIGDDDLPFLWDGSLLMHERIPYSQLFVVPGSGHWPMVERPGLFFPAVLRFLATTHTLSPLFAREQHLPVGECLTKTTLSERLRFAEVDRAREILGRSDAWARQLSAFDRGVRMKTTEPTNTREFLEFISGEAASWTDDEQLYWKSLIDQLSEALEGMNLNIPDAYMVKTTGLEEFNAVYVRNQAIILPQRRVDIAGDVRRDFFLLAHELFHLLSLENPSWRDELYALIGFRRFSGFEYPAELEGRRLSNPMYGARHEYALTVQTASGPVDVTPVYQAAVSLEEFITISMGHPRELFEAIDFVLLPVDTGTRTVLRDDSGNLIIYHFGDTDWIEHMQRNSSYIIHPDELIAENFALLMEWRRSGTLPESVPGGPGEGFRVNDIELLTEIEKVLTAGCGE